MGEIQCQNISVMMKRDNSQNRMALSTNFLLFLLFLLDLYSRIKKDNYGTGKYGRKVT